MSALVVTGGHEPPPWWIGAVLAVAAGLMMLLGGCAPDYTPRPGQTKATEIVWFQTYQEGHAPPPIEWVYAPDLNCEPTDIGDVGFELDGECVAGVSYQDRVRVAWALEERQYSHTAFAHELLHVHLYFADGDGDALHQRPEWRTLLPAANRALGEAGL